MPQNANECRGAAHLPPGEGEVPDSAQFDIQQQALVPMLPGDDQALGRSPAMCFPDAANSTQLQRLALTAATGLGICSLHRMLMEAFTRDSQGPKPTAELPSFHHHACSIQAVQCIYQGF
jgi:hypothetical protein